MDMVKKDGSAAIFTKRVNQDKQTVLVGAEESYQAVSRESFLLIK